MRIFLLKRSPDNESIDATPIRTVKPHTTPVVVLAVDRTSTLFATGGTDGTVKVWDIAGGYVTHTFRGPSVLVTALHFFEVAGRAQDAKIAKGKKGRQPEAQAEEAVDETVVTYRLAAGSQDGKIKIWDLNKRNCVATLDSHVTNVQGLDYSPEQQALVSGSRDKTVTWWDAKSWKIRKVVPCLELVEAVGFLDQGRLTFTAGAAGCLRIRDSETGQELTPKQPAKSEEEGIVAAIYRPGHSYIMCVQVDHTLALYRPPTKASLDPSSPPEPFRRISGTHDEIIDLAYLLPDHSMLALATNSEDVRLVSATQNSQHASQSLSEDSDVSYFGQDIGLLKGHEDIVITLDVDWSGHWVVTGAKDNTARLWRVDAANGSFECWAVFTGHAESLGAVALPSAIPPESSAARTDPLNHPPEFIITGSQDQTVKKWEVPRTPQTKNSKSATRALFTRKAHDKDINALTVHSNGRVFASASQDKSVKIWSCAEGEVQGILRGHKRGVWSVRFSPEKMPAIQGEDGPVTSKGVVLTGSGDKTIKIWSLSDYTCIRTCEGHSNSVLKVAWLGVPMGADRAKAPVLFASAGGDGLVKVWDANSGETQCTLDNHEDRVWALAVNPESNAIVSGSGDSTVTVWKDTTIETQTAAAEQASRLIEQEQELQNHIHAGSYRDAITLALQLNHPGRLLSLFTSVVTSTKPDPGSLSGLKAVDQVLSDLTDDQLFILLLRLRDWNTNARTAPIAQRILWALVRSYPASRLSNLSVKGARGQKSLKDILHALRVYTERHYKRMEELVDESYLVEYTLREMDDIAPALGDGDASLEDGVDGQMDTIMVG